MTPNKAIKNRAFHALDSQQVARLLWRRYASIMNRLTFSLVLLFVSSCCFATVVLPGATQIRECGNEDRDENGQLSPLAIGDILTPTCENCSITFNFNTPDTGGEPVVLSVSSTGLLKDQEAWLTKWFEDSWKFPYCKTNEGHKGFENEARSIHWKEGSRITKRSSTFRQQAGSTGRSSAAPLN